MCYVYGTPGGDIGKGVGVTDIAEGKGVQTCSNIGFIFVARISNGEGYRLMGWPGYGPVTAGMMVSEEPGDTQFYIQIVVFSVGSGRGGINVCVSKGCDLCCTYPWSRLGMGAEFGGNDGDVYPFP